jgi:protein-L-isoaspartate(D-aspartate) O-methyltransferase
MASPFRPDPPDAGTSDEEAPAWPEAVDPPDEKARRDRLIDHLVASGAVRDPRVEAAMRRVPRHQLVPEAVRDQAYGDHPVQIAPEQTASQPTIVGIMTEALDLRGGERVLEIGTGSGYQAAILSLLAREVLTVERVTALGVRARADLERLGFQRLRFRIGDGYRGWPEEAPFDRILLTAAPPSIPEELVAQLAEGGILVAPVGAASERQRLLRGARRGEEVRYQDLGAVSFIPLIPDTTHPRLWS